MILLHGLKGQIVSQIQKDFLRDDVAMLASNVIQVQNSQWQSLSKIRVSNVGFPKEYCFALGLHDANSKEPYFIKLSEIEAKGKLRAWGVVASEIEKLIQTEVE